MKNQAIQLTKGNIECDDNQFSSFHVSYSKALFFIVSVIVLVVSSDVRIALFVRSSLRETEGHRDILNSYRMLD